MLRNIKNLLNFSQTSKYQSNTSIPQLIDILRSNQQIKDSELMKIVKNFNRYNSEKIFVLPRIDIENLPNEHLEVTQPGYTFSIAPIVKVYGQQNHFFNNQLQISKSNGGKNLRLCGVKVYPGWDIIEFSNKALHPQLNNSNQNLIQSYVQENRLIGWSNSQFILRDPVILNKFYYKKAIPLFGSYMNQWGHLMIDMLFRTLSLKSYINKLPILIDEETPKNFIEILTHLYGVIDIHLIKSRSVVKIEEAVIPLSRTLCPVGWLPSLDRRSGWGWNLDAPAARTIQKLSENKSGSNTKRERKIYFKRVQTNKAIINQDEVEKVLIDHNFEFIKTEDTNFKDLLAIMNEAKVIAGVNSSQMLNIMFANPGLNLVSIQSSRSVMRNISAAIPYLGHKEYAVFCEAEYKKSYAELTNYEKKQLSLMVNVKELNSAITAAN